MLSGWNPTELAGLILTRDKYQMIVLSPHALLYKDGFAEGRFLADGQRQELICVSQDKWQAFLDIFKIGGKKMTRYCVHHKNGIDVIEAESYIVDSTGTLSLSFYDGEKGPYDVATFNTEEWKLIHPLYVKVSGCPNSPKEENDERVAAHAGG